MRAKAERVVRAACAGFLLCLTRGRRFCMGVQGTGAGLEPGHRDKKDVCRVLNVGDGHDSYMTLALSCKDVLMDTLSRCGKEAGVQAVEQLH